MQEGNMVQENEKLIGQINIPNVDPELERAVIQFKNRFKITKAEAARILLRDGLSTLGKKDRLVRHAMA